MRRVDDAELERLWPTRLPDKELAARLGHHRSVVRRRAAALGLSPRRLIWSQQVFPPGNFEDDCGQNLPASARAGTRYGQ